MAHKQKILSLTYFNPSIQPKKEIQNLKQQTLLLILRVLELSKVTKPCYH